MLQRTRGLVLRAKDYGESNQIVLIYSEQAGKFTLMARGAKKTRSRLGAATEPFTEAEFLFFQGSGMATLSQADVINAHSRIREDLLLSAYGAYWLDLLDQLTEEKDLHPSLYRSISQLIALLEQQMDPEMLTRIWELRLLAIAGYRPIFAHCIRCQQRSYPVRMSFAQGGILCSSCWQYDANAEPVSNQAVQLLIQLDGLELNRLRQIQVKTENKEELERVLQRFFMYHIPLQLKTRNFLQHIRSLYQ